MLANLRQKGHANGTLRGVRATFSTVLKTAVERDYLEKNPLLTALAFASTVCEERAAPLFTRPGSASVA